MNISPITLDGYIEN